jgi:hypothetical protein
MLSYNKPFFNERSPSSIVLCAVYFFLLRVSFPNIAAAPRIIFLCNDILYKYVLLKIHEK